MKNLNNKILLRRIRNKPAFFLINLIGLSLAIAACLFIFIYVHYESTYDNFHGKNTIYQVIANTKWESNGPEYHQRWIGPPAAHDLKEEIPEVEMAFRYIPWDREWLCEYKGKYVKIKNIKGSDPGLFKCFNIPFLYGNPDEALNDPNKIVLNQTTAKQIFGDANPVGEIVIINQSDTFEVTGVVIDYPKNSCISFNAIHSITDYWRNGGGSYFDHTLFVFATLNDNVNVNLVNNKLIDFTKRHIGEKIQRTLGLSFEEYMKSGKYYRFYLKPLDEIYHKLENEHGKPLTAKLSLLFTICILILIIAIINYSNLNIFQIISRSKELAIKKTVGSGTRRLFIIELTETIIIVFISILLAFIIITLFLPAFNHLIDRDLKFNLFLNPIYYFGIPIGGLLISILASIIPSININGIGPIRSFSQTGLFKHSNFSIKQALIIAQFIIAISILSITLAMQKQVKFLTKKELGFTPEQILVIKDAYNLRPDIFRNEILKNPYIDMVSFCNTIPGRHYNNQGVHVKGKSRSEGKYANSFRGDYYLKDILNMEIVEGTWFSQDKRKNTSSCIVNEAALNFLNIDDDPLGYSLDDAPFNSSKGELYIIGVVKNFNYKSLQNVIEPMIIYPDLRNDYCMLKFNPSYTKEVLETTTKIWNSQTNELPLEHFFLDNDFNSNYAQEIQLGKIFLLFTILSIVLTALGLLGIGSYLITSRIKEIGIRKVNGARIAEIQTLLVKNFVKWVVIAFIAAYPIAWYALDKWLQTYAYKTPLSWWIFVLAGGIALVIALLTVSLQSWRAARKNPVEALRYE